MAKKQKQNTAPTRFSPPLLLSLITIACLLPFVGRAFNIDEPLFVWAAQHIRAHPLDPYGLQLNWDTTLKPMFEVTKNPPLASYYLAAASLLVGWKETGLHLFFVIPAVAAALGAHRIARRYCSNALPATLAAVFTPVFLVSATTVMCDVMTAAFWVWAVVLWVEGLDEDRHSKLAASAFLIAICALTKYSGIALIPLLLVYSFAKKKRGAWRAVHLAIPIILLVAYEYVTKAHYGRGLLLDAASFSRQITNETGDSSGQKLLTTLSFSGGCFVGLLFLAPLLWSKKGMLAGLAAIGLAILGISRLAAIGQFPLSLDGHRQWNLIVQLSVLAILGVSLIVLAVCDLLKHRSADSVLLVMWVGAALVFAGALNWSINARSLLPAFPAVGILLVRRLEYKSKSPDAAVTRWTLAALGAAAVFSLWVAACDCSIADANRSAALSLCGKYGGGQAIVWSQGHWGFQYYMQQNGAQEVDFESTRPKPGDVIILPENNTHTIPPPAGRTHVAETLEIPTAGGVSTMRPMVAGFYADAWGPLPFVLGPTEPERFVVFAVP